MILCIASLPPKACLLHRVGTLLLGLLVLDAQSRAAPSDERGQADQYQRAYNACLARRTALHAERALAKLNPPVLLRSRAQVGGTDWRPLFVTPRICLVDLVYEGIRISGGMPHALMTRQRRTHTARLGACEAGLGRHGPAGLAWIDLHVDRAGRVTRHSVRGPKALSSIAACVARTIRDWRYEQPVMPEGKISFSLIVLTP
ncbi:MAG: hypothetical protein RBU30_09035 [Polyangia bacterium]|jgi:hypothetical protein|nr:hypothetical protein [Polyangia bacterium]